MEKTSAIAVRATELRTGDIVIASDGARSRVAGTSKTALGDVRVILPNTDILVRGSFPFTVEAAV
ncbi:hypothetical protein ACFOYW_13195 [Gryllotalpicola reticulitermitis]|uniref:Uncharacterized protein n=1 Tax=Gryllotalpicola reticulitermitis TaxID=1184153 RepID=A0ABV8QAR5_9MICO